MGKGSGREGGNGSGSAAVAEEDVVMREGPALEGTVGEAAATVADGDGDGEDDGLEGSCTNQHVISHSTNIKTWHLRISAGMTSPKLATARKLFCVMANVAL